MRSSSATAYDILNIPTDATITEIKRAYRKMSLLCHPDRHPGCQKSKRLFDDITKAYDELKNNTNTSLITISPTTQQQQPNNQPIPTMQMTLDVTMDEVMNGGILPMRIRRTVCENNTQRDEPETIYVTVSKGVDDGEIIYIREKGNIEHGQSGDIRISVRVVNTSILIRDGLNLICNHTITLKESLCGFIFHLPHPNGKVYTINNLDNGLVTPTGYKKIIPKLGIPRDSCIGNLTICFTVSFPASLSPVIRSAIAELL